MTPEQAQREWERACERVGVEPEFAPCPNVEDEDICGELQIPPSDYLCPFHRNGGGRIWPPIDDPAATLAMLEWFLKGGYIVQFRPAPSDYNDTIVGVFDREEGQCLKFTEPHRNARLALAAAVNAIPQEK